MSPISRTASLAAGVALIVLPLLALLLKFLTPGWMLLVVFVVSPVLAIGYIMQVAIAITGFLTARAVFRTSRRGRTAAILAWAGSIAVLLTVLFMPEGGDTSWGSAFQVIIGAENDVFLSDLSTAISFVVGAVWVVTWVWLLVLWILALRERSNQRVNV